MNQFQKDVRRWVDNSVDNDHYAQYLETFRQKAYAEGEDRLAADLCKLLKKRFNFIRNCADSVEIEFKEKGWKSAGRRKAVV